jgi:pyruvate/2-oxoglutarate dehydrogenase complex dihydrolipoamide acyltransferase (E2) component
MKSNTEGYRLESVPKMRRFSLDAGWLGRRRHIVHALIQAHVTDARELMRAHQRSTGETLSFTAWIISCLAIAAGRHPHVHAYRDWRRRLVIFDDVNVNTLVEVEMQGRKVPMPHIVKAANRRSIREIHDEIRATQARPTQNRSRHRRRCTFRSLCE